jgi:transposase InsO family protein
MSDYQDFQDVSIQTGRFIVDVYTTIRIRLSLGYLTPAEFEPAYRLPQTQETEDPPKNH